MSTNTQLNLRKLSSTSIICRIKYQIYMRLILPIICVLMATKPQYFKIYFFNLSNFDLLAINVNKIKIKIFLCYCKKKFGLLYLFTKFHCMQPVFSQFLSKSLTNVGLRIQYFTKLRIIYALISFCIRQLQRWSEKIKCYKY